MGNRHVSDSILPSSYFFLGFFLLLFCHQEPCQSTSLSVTRRKPEYLGEIENENILQQQDFIYHFKQCNFSVEVSFFHESVATTVVTANFQ
jgi:hypothetical protein